MTPERPPTGIEPKPQGKLTLTLPETGRLDLALQIDVIARFWHYLVIGAPDDAVPVDDAGGITFTDLGDIRLPNRTVARRFASDARIPLGNRPAQRFRLIGAAGTYVPQLPVAGVDGLRVVPGQDGAGEEPIVEIYVTH